MKLLQSRINAVKDDSEHGAISTLMLLLLTSGVVVSLLALVVDAGALQLERRESQQTADQVAIAMAAFCSSTVTADSCAPNGTSSNKIDAILSAVNPQQPAQLGEICSSGSLNLMNPNISSCQGLMGIKYDCTQPDEAANPWWRFWVRSYVKVNTASQTSALFPLTGPLLGVSENTAFWACSQYAFGPAGTAKIVNSILPIAFNPCEISISNSSVIARSGDSSTAACSITDYGNESATYANHGIYRWEAGASSGPCANGTTLDVGEIICISSKTPTQIGVYYPSTLQLLTSSAVSKATLTMLPVVDGLTGSSVTDGTKGTFATAKVIGFVGVTIIGYKSGIYSSGTAPSGGWNERCATSTVMCINGKLSQKLSTLGTIVQDATSQNFGVTALSPMN